MDDIATLCDSVVVMNKGVVAFAGKPEPAISHYRELMEGSAPATADSRVERALGVLLEPAPCLQNLIHEWTDPLGNPITETESGAEIRFRISFDLLEPIKSLNIGVPVFTEEGVYLSGFSSMDMTGETLQSQLGKNRFEIVISVCPFNAGIYYSVTAIRDGPGFLARVANSPLLVTTKKNRSWGTVSVPHEWRVLSAVRQ
jgi:hypothetical protein